MDIQFYLVIFIVLAMIVLLVMEVFRAEIVLVFVLLTFMFLGIISPAEALSGFSNEGVWTIILLFIIVGVIQKSNFLNQYIIRSLQKSKSISGATFRLMSPIAIIASFLNNTPIVMYFTPIIKKWCEERGIAPSKLLISISYASIFGGVITLIGTSTNLIIHGLAIEAGEKGFSMFDFTLIGLPAALVGVLYMTFIGSRLLPERETDSGMQGKQRQDYFTEASIPTDSVLIGQKLNESALFQLKRAELLQIIRSDGTKVAPITGYEIIRENDRLIFTTTVDGINELHGAAGLHIHTGSDVHLKDLEDDDIYLYELIVSQGSELAYKTVKDSSFRLHYNASIVSVSGHHEEAERIADMVLKPGDVILVLAKTDFEKKHRDTRDFFFLNMSQIEVASFKKKNVFNLLVFVGVILLATFQILSMFQACVLAVVIYMISKASRAQDLRDQIHVPTILLVASSVGIGGAIQNSGVAEYLAAFIVSSTAVLGMFGAVVLLYLFTSLLTEFISNAASAVIAFPIALEMAHILGVDPLGFFLLIAFAASTSFSTPISYQTNLMVYTAGGYKFIDFVKVGLPLNILYTIIVCTFIYFFYY